MKRLIILLAALTLVAPSVASARTLSGVQWNDDLCVVDVGVYIDPDGRVEPYTLVYGCD